MSDVARRMWRASKLGLDFWVRSLLSMRNWIVRGWKEVSDKFILIESTVNMWIIWCRRNALLFRHFKDPPHAGYIGGSISSLAMITDGDYEGGAEEG